MLKTYLIVYVIVYITWYLINKVFDGQPDKYLRAKIWYIFETQYGIIVPEDMKQNPLKYLLADLKSMLHKKGGKKHKDE